ncbi:hypothetical protein BJ165DRAFT_1517941 [Panaeolus papilionaceus]|nr:hypothetical protein BJ165DRAFT_1517941 [Panaeolus papilionaceus]
MNTGRQVKFNHLTFSGAVSVEQVEKIIESKGYILYVLLGPTGSGKSSFIEAVASDTSLCLSSSSLEGFTQSINIYRILNVVKNQRLPIYLVDVPGFADNRISTISIVSMLKELIQTTRVYTFRILYLVPINNPRLPGSQRRLLQTLGALTGIDSAELITIVSTMWDSIWGENAKTRAESNFNQLRNEIWKDYIDNGSRIVRFENTQESALTILDETVNVQQYGDFHLRKSIALPLRETSFASNIYDNLHIRIQNLEIQQANIQSELQVAMERSEEELVAVLLPRLEEVQALLAEFEQELQDFGSAPDLPLTVGGDTAQSHTPLSHSYLHIKNPIITSPGSKKPKGGVFIRAVDLAKRWGKRHDKHREDCH